MSLADALIPAIAYFFYFQTLFHGKLYDYFFNS